MTYKVYGYIKTKLNYPTEDGAYTEKLNNRLTEELEYTLDNYEHYRVSCVPIIQRVKVPSGKAEKIGRPLDIELSDNILDRDFDFSLLVGHVLNFVIEDVYKNPPKNVGELIFAHINGHVDSFDGIFGDEGEVTFFSIVEWGCSIETLNGVYVYKNGKPLTVAVPEVKAKLKAFERREERTKKARARREYNQYAWREAKELGLHRAEYEAIRLKVDYNFRRLVKMIRELASRGEIEKVGYSGMVAEIFGIIARHDIDALVSIGNDPHNSLTFSRMTRYAEKALYGDY